MIYIQQKKKQFEKGKVYFRKSGFYKLTAIGKLDLYPLFTEWFQKEWLKERCAKYIIQRTDDYALPYLQNTFPSVIEYKEKKILENK